MDFKKNMWRISLGRRAALGDILVKRDKTERRE